MPSMALDQGVFDWQDVAIFFSMCSEALSAKTAASEVVSIAPYVLANSLARWLQSACSLPPDRHQTKGMEPDNHIQLRCSDWYADAA